MSECMRYLDLETCRILSKEPSQEEEKQITQAIGSRYDEQ